MKRKNAIKFKAAFLLIVFGLNTVVGFACSISLDMGFNTSHHKVKTTDPAIHIHANGKKHLHHSAPAAPAIHVHANGKKHEHPAASAKQHHDDKKIPGNEKDNCCNDDVLKFQNLDKNINQQVKIIFNAPVLAALLNSFFQFDISLAVAQPLLPIVRYLFPPPPNILIAIHRFQV